MEVNRAEVSSMATTLRELSGRIVALADTVAGADDEGAVEASVLYEVERALASAARRLDRLAEGRLR